MSTVLFYDQVNKTICAKIHLFYIVYYHATWTGAGGEKTIAD